MMNREMRDLFEGDISEDEVIEKFKSMYYNNKFKLD